MVRMTAQDPVYLAPGGAVSLQQVSKVLMHTRFCPRRFHLMRDADLLCVTGICCPRPRQILGFGIVACDTMEHLPAPSATLGATLRRCDLQAATGAKLTSKTLPA